MTTRTCPSAPATPGALMIGMRGADGRVANLRTPLRVDTAFCEDARARGDRPEARMRFAAPCIEEGCAQWTGSRCGVIARVLDHLEDALPPTPALPPCAIRADCRWYAEHAERACAACPEVVTDARTADDRAEDNPAELAATGDAGR